jgi:hypothetical protein
MQNIVETLMARDSITENEAKELIVEAKKQFDVYLEEGDFEGAENICQEYFGLEPDYIFEVMA